MKQCLITGGGSKFGQKITDQLIEAGYHVYLITGNAQNYVNNPNVTVLSVDWKKLNLLDIRILIKNLPDLNLIFFNHNSSSLSQSKFSKNQLHSIADWQQSYFVACQFPFYLIHALKNKILPDTQIGWMLSSLISNPESSQVGFADYIGNKFTNACIMKSFSQSFPAVFFGINPESVGGDDATVDINKATAIVKLIESNTVVNGKIYYSNGHLFDF